MYYLTELTVEQMRRKHFVSELERRTVTSFYFFLSAFQSILRNIQTFIMYNSDRE